MKPSFALNFADDSIGLLHRTSRGWLEVGSVPLDEPDLGQAVAYLRGSALGLEPRGITTKLVIPNSQIRYMTLAAPGPDAASRRSQIKAELEGRTPYPVDDLVFDWWGKGPTVEVAVVARETLDEAEAFARDNRLNPLSFVAIPEPGTFGAEPWFGASSMAPTLLVSGEKVDRDQDPIQIVGRIPKPEAAAEPAADMAPVEAQRSEPVETPAEPDPALPVASAPVAAEATPEHPVMAEAPAEPPVADVAQVVPAGVTVDRIVDDMPGDPVKDTATEPAPAAAAPTPAAPVPPMPTVIASPSGTVVTDPRLAKKQPAPATRPPAKTPLRAPEPAKRPGPAPGAPRLSAIPGGGGGARGGKFAVPIPEAEWPLERVTSAARVAQGKTEATRSSAMITAPGIPMQRERKLSIVPQGASDGQTGTDAAADRARSGPEPKTVFGAQQSRQRGKPRFLGLILTVILLAILAAIAMWSSIFVARNGDEATPAVASAPAAGITAPDAVATETETVALPAIEPVPETPTDTALPLPDANREAAAGAADPDTAGPAPEPAPDDEMLADGQYPDTLASAPEAATSPATSLAAKESAPAITAEPATDLAAADPAAETPAPAPATPAVESATVAVPDTSAASGRTPADDPQDEIFLAMVDPALETPDVIALAAPLTTTDAEPVAQLAPPPFGTLYQFDAEGRIIPTKDGIITPEGVRLVAGPPPRVPPARPVIVAETPVAAPVAEPVAEPAAAEPAYADPALAGARPRARPEGLVPASAAAADDGAALTVTDTVRISSLKPRARPPEIFAQGEAARAAEDAALNAATTAAVQAAAASLVDPDAGAVSPLAISVSRKPAPRPKDFNRAIEEAVTVAAADATLTIASPIVVPDAPVAAAASIKVPVVKEPVEEKLASFGSNTDDTAIVEQDEPERSSAAPRIPTKSSVAKQATYRNAINLEKTNLIGVYGTSSKRYAMVRNANGRFVKVEVGDRIDGGRVAAISDKELHYVKDGQTHTLKMPKG